MKIKRFTPPPEVTYVTYAVYIDHDLDHMATLDPSYHSLWIDHSDGGSLIVDRPAADGSRLSLSNGQWLVRLSDGTKVVTSSERLRAYVTQCGQEWPDD